MQNIKYMLCVYNMKNNNSSINDTIHKAHVCAVTQGYNINQNLSIGSNGNHMHTTHSDRQCLNTFWFSVGMTNQILYLATI